MPTNTWRNECLEYKNIYVVYVYTLFIFSLTLATPDFA